MNKNTLKTIILGGLFIIPFIPFFVSSSFFFPFITTKGFAFRIIVEIIFAAWLVLMLAEPEYRLKKSYILYALGAFLVVIGLADIFGAAPLKSFWSNAERMEGYIALLHLGMFFIVIASVFREIDWRRWWNTSLIASALMVIYALFQLAGVATIHQGGVRVDGSLGNATYLAVYMLIHIFVALMFFLRETKKGLRWAYGILIAMQVVILYHTATRGAILGLLGGLLIVALLNIRNRENKAMRKTSIAVLVALAVLVTGFFALRDTSFVQGSPVLSRFASISTEEIKSGGRAFVWPMAIEGIKERPFLGWGQENFNYVFNTHYSPQMYHLEPWFDRAHNIFLDWGIAGGILGLLSYLSLYAVLLWLLWRRSDFQYAEKTLLTGLVAAYFFHNFFVFDQLISYILFFSLLAYVHMRSQPSLLMNENPIEDKGMKAILPAAILGLVLILYFFNLRPLMANANLIEALKILQTPGAEMSQAVDKFKKAYNRSRLGRPEVVEQMASNAATVLSSNLSVDAKNDFYNFVRSAVVRQAEDLPTDARYQILAGSFLSQTGNHEEALKYLRKARELIPGKQQVYFETGSAYINAGNIPAGLAEFKSAYDLAPEYMEAKIIYLIGAIYADDRVLEQRLLSEIPPQTVATDDRILGTYYNAERYNEAVRLLEKRIELDPANEGTYREYIRQIREQA